MIVFNIGASKGKPMVSTVSLAGIGHLRALGVILAVTEMLSQAKHWGKIERRHFEYTGRQISLLQALFRRLVNLEVEQLNFRELFRVCFH